MEPYSIHDLDKLSGIKAATIRVWERRFKIVTPHRTGTNRRRYGDEELRRIINISILKRNGFKISKIAKFSASEIEEKVTFLSKDVFHPDTQIDSLVAATVDYNEKAVNDILIRSMMNKGMEETMSAIVFPFLKRIGIMWHTGTVNVASEHFITNIFRHKLISATDTLSSVLKPERKKILLFLPENELHDIGLLFFNYVIRKMGHESLYLGQSTPLFAVAEISNQWKGDIVITGLMSDFPGLKSDEYLADLVKLFPKQKILVAGDFAKSTHILNDKRLIRLQSLEDLKSQF